MTVTTIHEIEGNDKKVFSGISGIGFNFSVRLELAECATEK
jgi:hypothetical protein